MSDLSPKERAFLDAVRKDWGPSEDVKKSVRAGLPLALRTSPELSPDLGAAPGPAAGAGPGAGAAASGVSRAMWGAGVGLVAIGLCVAGLVWTRGSDRPSEPPPARDAVTSAVAAPQLAPAAPSTAAVDAPAAPSDAVSLDSLPNAPAQRPAAQQPSALNAPSTPSTPAPSGSGDTLAEELALLRTAQTALRAGAPADALAALSKHAARFPRGALREERMTLQVLALCDRGDVAGARAAKAELERSAPGSSHLQRLASSCAAR